MNKHDLLELIASNKKFFVLVFCVLFGVIAGESYNTLKNNGEPRFRKIFHRVIVALFVCALCTPVIDHFDSAGKFYPFIILFVSCVSMRVLGWLIGDLLPALLKTLKSMLINILLNNKNKKDGTPDEVS